MSLERAAQGMSILSGCVTVLTLPLNCAGTYLAWRMYHFQVNPQVAGQPGAVAAASVSHLLWIAGIMAVATLAAAFLSWRAWRLYSSFRFDRRPKLTVETNWKPVPNSLGNFSTSLARPLTLVNDSDSPGFNVTVRPITLGQYTANFECESVVRRGKSVTANIRVEGFSALQHGDLHWMFVKEVNYRGDLDPVITVPIFVDYMDSDRKEYETEQEMTYNTFTKEAEFRLIHQGQRRKLRSRK
jgi:hypothetical protein